MQVKKCLNSIIIRAVFVFIIVTNFGCKRIPGASDAYYIQREVQPKELVGKWSISDSIVEKLLQEGFTKHIEKEQHFLLLDEDGNCSVNTFDYLTISMATSEELNYINGSKAKWWIGKSTTYIFHQYKDVPSVNIQIKEEKDYVLNTTEISFYIAEDDNGVFLWRYIGDPDCRNYYILRKCLSDPNKMS